MIRPPDPSSNHSHADRAPDGHDPKGGPRLSPADAAALDALAQAAWRASDPAGRDAALSRLLAPLAEVAIDRDESLIDATMARVLRARLGPAPARLSADDDAALEAWALAGYQSGRVASSLRARARKHEDLARLATAVAAPSASESGLVDRTLSAIRSERSARAGELRLADRPASRGRFTIRMADLVAAAAMLMIAWAVIWPVMSSVRNESRRLACQANFGRAAGAMGAYAGEHDSTLPLALAGFQDGRWWDVGRHGRSNSANLFELTRAGFATVADLACPGNPHALRADPGPSARDWRSIEEVSYSYQIMSGPWRPAWTGIAREVALTDASPIVRKSMRDQWVDLDSGSMNHRSRGQFVLFTDGSARWLTTPVLENGDHLWLNGVLEAVIRDLVARREGGLLKGVEQPAGASDAFVGP